RLQEAVAAVAAEAAERGEDPAITFDRVRALADEAAGIPARSKIASRLHPDRRRPPRLTEPWFC
ncbi:MAG: radical SAM protein, partial [Candidatus Rokuibacteriota bacterium]